MYSILDSSCQLWGEHFQMSGGVF